MVLRSGSGIETKGCLIQAPKLYSEAVAMTQAINEGHDFKINWNIHFANESF